MHYLSLNKKSSQPYYQQIEDSIENAIRLGTLKHGDRLATVNEVAQFFNVSIMAPRQAYENLERKGHVTSFKGKGTFVNARPVVTIPLDNFYQKKYFLPDKDWVLKSYISYFNQDREITELYVQTHLNDYPVSYHEYQFVIPIDETRLKMHQGNVIDYNFLDTITPVDIKTLETDFLAKSASHIDAQILKVNFKDPLIRLHTHMFASDHTLIGEVDTYYPSDYVRFNSNH